MVCVALIRSKTYRLTTVVSLCDSAYTAIAFQFLACADLPIIQRSPETLAAIVDHRALSNVISTAILSGQKVDTASRDDQLWLLAHFIALSRASPGGQDTVYLRALYLQLSRLATDIRLRYNQEDALDDDQVSDEDDLKMVDPTSSTLPRFITNQLEFLVNDEGISELLRRFTTLVPVISLLLS